MNTEMEQVSGDSIFDKHVPIVSLASGDDQFTTTVHIVNEIAEPHLYVELVTILESAKEGDTIVFNFNCPGGRLDTTMMLLDAMENTEATTIGRITGECASAATMMIMKVDELEVHRWGSMMIHNYTGGLYGKGGEIKTRTAFEIPHLEAFFYDTYKKFLSKKECAKIIKDGDKYMDANEIVNRWDVLTDWRNKKAEAIMLEAQEEGNMSLIAHLEAQGYSVSKPED